VKSVDISLENQVVRVLGSTTVKDMTAALAESGRKARLIGQGLPESKFLLVDFL
jgi:copper chaperone for superoxide dismutase